MTRRSLPALSPVWPRRNDYNPHARSCFNCVRQSRRVYVYINKFLPPSPPRLLHYFRRLSGHVNRKRTRLCPSLSFPFPIEQRSFPPLHWPRIENVCAFISPGLRAPIECKIMATCRIFAGATVTNISDKALSCAGTHLTLPRAVSFHPISSHPGAVCRVPYLSILIYRELILCRYHIFDPPRARVARAMISIRETRHAARAVAPATDESSTERKNFPSRELKLRNVILRVATIDSPLGRFRGSLRSEIYFRYV